MARFKARPYKPPRYFVVHMILCVQYIRPKNVQYIPLYVAAHSYLASNLVKYVNSVRNTRHNVSTCY